MSGLNVLLEHAKDHFESLLKTRIKEFKIDSGCFEVFLFSKRDLEVLLALDGKKIRYGERGDQTSTLGVEQKFFEMSSRLIDEKMKVWLRQEGEVQELKEVRSTPPPPQNSRPPRVVFLELLLLRAIIIPTTTKLCAIGGFLPLPFTGAAKCFPPSFI